LTKGSGYGLFYTYYPKQDTLRLRIPEQRLDQDDLENGLTHELTEAFLRKLVKELENYFVTDEEMETKAVYHHNFVEEPFHAVATLSGDRYDFVAHYYDFLEAKFEEAQRYRKQ
jgi:hypothetical protein